MSRKLSKGPEAILRPSGLHGQVSHQKAILVRYPGPSHPLDCRAPDNPLSLAASEGRQRRVDSPEIKQIRFVPLSDLNNYDLFSSDIRFLRQDLARREPALVTSES